MIGSKIGRAFNYIYSVEAINIDTVITFHTYTSHLTAIVIGLNCIDDFDVMIS